MGFFEPKTTGKSVVFGVVFVVSIDILGYRDHFRKNELLIAILCKSVVFIVVFRILAVVYLQP